MNTRYFFLQVILLVFVSVSYSSASDWKKVFQKELPEYGHRNWIVIADSAYPKQSAPGIETIYARGNQLEVVEYVLNSIDKSKHIRPLIMFDNELKFVSEKSASGVESYRKGLNDLLGNRPTKEMSHEDIIHKLDKASELFNVLILKTDLTIPYTTVFIELDCGYWSEDKESSLRELMKIQ